MTAHELAKLLLTLPDVRVYFDDNEHGLTEISEALIRKAGDRKPCDHIILQ